MVLWSLVGALVELLLATAVGAGGGSVRGRRDAPGADVDAGPRGLRDPPASVRTVRFSRTLALVLGVALLLFGTAFLWARARETCGSVGGGSARLAAAAAVYAVTTTVALQTV
jgi:hypothetical protein